MKKTLTLLVALALFVPSRAQDDEKNFRFGLKVTPSFNWLKIDDSKTFTKNGIAMKFSYGLMTEFHLAGAAWFSTGFQVDYDGGKIATTMTAITDNTSGKMIYVYHKDKGFLEVEDWANNTDTTYESYLLKNRSYRSLYLTVPLQLRLKTKEIGFMTYFGTIGVNTSIQLKTRANDEIYTGSTGFTSGAKLEDLDISKDMNFMRLGLIIGGGAEWNLSGSTSLLFGLQFFQGFTNTVKTDSKYMADVELTNASSSNPPYVRQKQKFLNNHFGINLGVLF